MKKLSTKSLIIIIIIGVLVAVVPISNWREQVIFDRVVKELDERDKERWEVLEKVLEEQIKMWEEFGKAWEELGKELEGLEEEWLEEWEELDKEWEGLLDEWE